MLPPGMGPQQPPPQQQTSMESHFMQQQSQIFVFSTDLANKAAESVLRGQVKSVIEYHIDQPSTKKFLQVISYFFLPFSCILFMPIDMFLDSIGMKSINSNSVLYLIQFCEDS